MGSGGMFETLSSIAYNVLTYSTMAMFMYLIIISAFGWVKRKNVAADKFPVSSRFAILIAAHNEQAVIGNIVRNLKQMNYPKSMYDIFVIADNCNDDTAAIAKENGAKVYERFDTVKKGKGHSLDWMFEKLFKLEIKYDAVCVFDADNLVSPNFLLEMNKHLCMGHKVVQGYLDSKNPYDSWIAANNSITFWITNRMFQLPRYYLGLSCVLGGTGFAVKTDVLKELGWGATCLTEDLEFTMKLVLKGLKVYWAHDAIIYDEKPLGMKQSWRQRRRWMQGHFDCMRRYFFGLVSKAYKDFDVVALDSAVYLLQPLIVVVNGAIMVCGLKVLIESIMVGDYIKLTTLLFFYLSAWFLLLEKRINLKTIKYFITAPIYNLTWIPIIIQGMINVNKKEWVHTLHTKVMEIDDMEALKKVG